MIREAKRGLRFIMECFMYKKPPNMRASNIKKEQEAKAKATPKLEEFGAQGFKV